MKMRGKVLGQHFLVNKHKLQKIIEVLDLKPGDTVIEIGPGHGELTNEVRIINYELRIIAIEKDKEFVQYLQKKIAEDKNIEIIQGDALKILPKIIDSIFRTSDVQKLKIVGNIPFYITGRILRTLSELENKPSLIVLTVQKEVAERICAQPPKMNLLAASVQFWAEPKIIDYISKKDFRPQPKVDSAIIKLNIWKSDFQKLKLSPSMLGKSDFPKINAEEYYKLIKILFKQPRKTILNNLINIKRSDLPKIDVNIWRSDLQKLLTKIGINYQDRPQNLTIEQIKKLAKQLKR